MKRNYSNKAILKATEEQTDLVEKPTLVCIKECHVISVGAFNVGDVITDPAKFERLKGNPYFVLSKTAEEDT